MGYRLARALALATCLCWLQSCSTGSEKKVDKVDAKGGGDTKAGKDAKPEVEVSGDFRTFTYSLSNNKATSYRINRKKAQEVADDIQKSIKKPDLKDRKELVTLMAVKRLAGGGFDQSLRVARTLVDIEMRESIARDLPELAKLELALAAVHDRKLAIAEHFLPDLTESKNKSIKAAAITAEGMIALIDGRLPEAVALWNQALGVEAEYRPALINLGFTSLKYGDYRTAQKSLGQMQDDWFALSGLIVAERLSGDTGRAGALCGKVLKEKPNYKPALFSCALNAYQGEGKLEEAHAQLTKLVKIDDGLKGIDEDAYKVIAAIEKERNEERQKANAAKAQKEKEEAAKKAAHEAANKAAAPGGASAPAANGHAPAPNAQPANNNGSKAPAPKPGG